MDTRREFIRKASALSAGAGFLHVLPTSIARALAIDPAPGSSFFDAEHIVLLMQENRSFDHTYGTLQGVRGFNDPRAIRLPDQNLVWLQSDNKGATYAPFRLDMKGTKATWMNSLPHSWSNQVDARNEGRHDKWLESKHSGNKDYAAMPLTLGYYSREDIPFYYSLADAFTVCDQHFCSSLTGTTPNRLYFWTGTIREKADENAVANVWNEDADYDSPAGWATFPERLEENGISWKIYQNEVSIGVGFEGEEDGWLANFGDNPIEYFTQYNVRFSPEFMAYLPKEAEKLNEELRKKEQQLPSLTAGSKEQQQATRRIESLKRQLARNAEDQLHYTKERFEQLSQRKKNLHQKAFTNNRNDPDYHHLDSLKYTDDSVEREVKIPKGDILHQFREDVNNGQLPTVSWIVAPENFSDHPAAAWYGAWYISEAMDILTRNPEVWKKTVFILTYDENDGYFDHVPPFVAPHPYDKSTGMVSKGIHTGMDYVANKAQQSNQEHARESSIGLGYRVPMVIASPWSRGGWVNSEVFDHTSSLQFLEKFLSHKTGKKIEESNISDWRRTVCGDLSSAFRPYNNEKLNKPEFLEKEEFIESIHKAQFKNLPSNFKALSPDEIAHINKQPHNSPHMAAQEKGIRSSCALPYELYADGSLSPDKKTFHISLRVGTDVFGKDTSGSPFQVYAPVKYGEQNVRTWAYGVIAGDELTDEWPLAEFEQAGYHLQVHGPNGFFREYKGNENDPALSAHGGYESKGGKKNLTGSISLELINNGSNNITIEITDNAYKTGSRSQQVAGNGGKSTVLVNTVKSYGWYDFSIRIKGNNAFEKRYAGRVETGKMSKTDPLMGQVL